MQHVSWFTSISTALNASLLLGFVDENEVKARAADVLGVAPESVKNWMQEFIPYWSKSIFLK